MRYALLILFGAVLLGGCNIINPSEQVPTFVHIDSFRFVNSNPDVYGSSSHNINTVFATYNGVPIGVFDLPCTIPVIVTGSNQLILQPGIAVNGFNDQESPYPFYINAIDTLVAQPGKVVNYTPVTGYVSSTSMVFKEDFEKGFQFFKYSDTGLINNTIPIPPGNDSMIIVTKSQDPTKVFEGQASGYINMPTRDSATEASQYFTIAANTPVLCELNYKSNVPIAIGLIPIILTTGATTQPQFNNLAFNPSPDQWTKIYINLAEIVSLYPADKYSLIIKTAVPYGQANGYALFDNIKVVTSK
ncbi:MAG: hypothetical protein P4L41_15650 [Flavipsychrobacter sp.]|nr:hypothetical protein [Flavipsychrobacter sp.]